MASRLLLLLTFLCTSLASAAAWQIPQTPTRQGTSRRTFLIQAPASILTAASPLAAVAITPDAAKDQWMAKTKWWFEPVEHFSILGLGCKEFQSHGKAFNCHKGRCDQDKVRVRVRVRCWICWPKLCDLAAK